MNQVPRKFKLKELTENVKHAIEGLGGVLEVAISLHPVEKVQGFFPVIAIRRERLAHRGVVVYW